MGVFLTYVKFFICLDKTLILGTIFFFSILTVHYLNRNLNTVTWIQVLSFIVGFMFGYLIMERG